MLVAVLIVAGLLVHFMLAAKEWPENTALFPQPDQLRQHNHATQHVYQLPCASTHNLGCAMRQYCLRELNNWRPTAKCDDASDRDHQTFYGLHHCS